MDYVKELVKLAQLDRPTELPSEDDWRRVEMELGYRLPADYKELISAFGSGDFGIDLGFLNPKATKDVALSKEYLVKYWGVIGWLEDIMDIRLFPNPGGLVTIGTNSNAMDIQLIPNQETKELKGLSILDVVGKQIEYLDMTVSEFIYKAYTNQVQTPLAKDVSHIAWYNPNYPLFTVRRSEYGLPIE